MKLTIRMALYFVFAFLSSQGIGLFDAESGDFTIKIENTVAAIGGLLAFLATFGWSRKEKASGGAT